MSTIWGYPPWLDGPLFILFFALLSILIAVVIAPAYRAWTDRKNHQPEIAEVSLRVEPPESDADTRRFRSEYVPVPLLILGAVFVFVKGSPPFRIFLAVSIVGGTAITLLTRYLAGHRPSISLEQSPGMTDEPRNTTLEQIDRDFSR